MTRFDYATIRLDVRESLVRYATTGCPTGGFLYAVLSGGSLSEVAGRADEDNVKTLPELAAFVHAVLPSGCHGSPERVRRWGGYVASNPLPDHVVERMYEKAMLIGEPDEYDYSDDDYSGPRGGEAASEMQHSQDMARGLK